MIHDISGKWNFTEEFECGLDKGFAFFIQNDTVLTGYLEYEEVIEEEAPFTVRQEISGTIQSDQINFKGVKAIGPDGSIIDDYNLDTLEGTLTHEGKIVGHSFDSENVCGVFVLIRE